MKNFRRTTAPDIEKLAEEVKINFHDLVALRAIGARIVARYGRRALDPVERRVKKLLI